MFLYYEQGGSENMQKTVIKWLGNKLIAKGGATWGIPWPKGELERYNTLRAEDGKGNGIPIQSWPTAYWPDGTVKWTAHSVAFTNEAPKEFCIIKGSEKKQNNNLNSIIIKEKDNSIFIDTGAVQCSFNRSGNEIINEIKAGGKTICSGGELVCLIEGRRKTSGLDTFTLFEYVSNITEVSIEQAGSIRSIIRVRGSHVSTKSDQRLIPFDVRFYFYAGIESIKIVHTFIYNGNPNTDFIKGLGIKFKVPQSGELYNRQVAFAGDKGIFRESPKGLSTWRTTGNYLEMYEKQQKGEFLEFDSREDEKFLELLDESAVWDSFKMVQLVSDSYSIFKRTKRGCTYVKALTGQRAKGLAYIGDQQAGLAASMRNFWQKNPASIEINGMSKSEAEMILWFWSTDAGVMDLRHYDTETHVYSAYEGFQEMRSTPYGIANTSEVTLWCLSSAPKNDELLKLAQFGDEPPQLVCEPGTYKNSGVFGEWGLIDRSTTERAYVEDQIDAILDFYKNEVEARKWYGFWDYGDVMHSYDNVRHNWKYDIGGFAWQNTELMPNLAIWYSFLRSGREEIYRMAEAMTRHNSEVDVYHIGEYAGLGSRHNVVHWGCGAKEARISMAMLNRYFYYLTADERMGDLLDEVKDADMAVAKLDPMRATIEHDSRFDTHVRTGPDIMAFCSNWFTRWERYEDLEYRDKLFKTLDFLKGNNNRFIAGKVFGYNALKTEYVETGLSHKDDHFHYCFGSQFIWVEIAEALNDDVLKKMCISLGEFHSPFSKNKDEVMKYWNVEGINLNMSLYHTGLGAFAAKETRNSALAEEVWNVLMDPKKTWMTFPVKTEKVFESEYPIDVNEIKSVSTNAMSQWTINAIMCLGLIGNKIPKEFYKKYDENCK